MILEKIFWTTIFIGIVYFNYEINRKITTKIYQEKESFAKSWNEINVDYDNVKIKKPIN